LPDGFAFRVVDFLGPGGVDPRGVRLVWVRGPMLDADGVPGKVLQLQVPLDQPRAVPVSRVRPASPRHAVGSAPVAPGPVDAAQAAAPGKYVTGPDGRRYRRVDFR
jgi:hypothetical protein